MPEDVIPADPSPADPTPPQEAVPAPGAVSPDPGVDRPVQNAVAEFNRKMAKLQSQYDTLVQYVTAQAQAGAQAQSTPKGDPTDDELWTLAQQGDRHAFDLYMRRVAAQTQQVQSRQSEYQRLVENQLSILAQRYPVLNDASHPLTQQVHATYQALMARGYQAGLATALEAVKTAIADRPDLVADLQARTRPIARQVGHAGVMGATVREPSTLPATKSLSADEVQLARRMGIKDPAKSKERFYQRQDQGKSSLGAVSSYVREE